MSATFTSMRGIKVDIMGNVYVSSKDKHIIRKISNNGVVTTICGTADTGNINGQNGTLNEPNGLLIDQHGDLYITELNGHIRGILSDSQPPAASFRAAGSGAAR